MIDFIDDQCGAYAVEPICRGLPSAEIPRDTPHTKTSFIAGLVNIEAGFILF